VSLVLPSEPQYDPWSWLVWGREVVHGSLDTVSGPSWKPLPILVTAPASLVAGAAPAILLVIARAGALGAVLIAGRLAYRIGGRTAAAILLALLLSATWFWQYPFTAQSEGVLVLFVLGAIDRHLAARHGQAFALVLAAALLRPEPWLFAGLYALWLVADSRERAVWVLPSLMLIPALWILPELWGSGNAWRAAERAQQFDANAPARSANPALVVVRHAVQQAPKVGLLGIATAVALVMFRRFSRGALRAAVVLAAVGASWLLIIAVMTQASVSSGIDRYLVTPLALATVLGAGSLGHASQLLRRSRLSRRVQLTAAAALAGAVVAGVVHSSVLWPATVDRVGRVAKIGADLDRAIINAGGKMTLWRCGPLYAPYLLSPSVAWRLGRRLEDVTARARAPGVLFRTEVFPHGPPDPPAAAFASTFPVRRLATTQYWQVEAAGACARRQPLRVETATTQTRRTLSPHRS
jgi:hypothetical protein